MNGALRTTPNLLRRVNRGSILKCILTHEDNTRVGIAEKLGLSKTTLTNIVSDMIAADILAETLGEPQSNHLGRKSMALELSPNAPLICGILVNRGWLCAVLSEMDGSFLQHLVEPLDAELTVETFREKLGRLFREIMARATRPVFAVSVAAIGPVDCEAGVMLHPTNFYQERVDFDLRAFLAEMTDLPIFITHDCSAAAMAEQLYGEGQEQENFLSLLLEQGISGGLCLDGRICSGLLGQNGEIGHTSIRFDGERCTCGNRGCLELYAGMPTMRRSAEAFRPFQPQHAIFHEKMDVHSVILMADAGDVLCQELLREYCSYVAHALCNVVTLLNLRTIYVCTPAEATNHVFEDILAQCLNQRLQPLTDNAQAQILSSRFGVEAPLYGAIAAVMRVVCVGKFFPFEQPDEPANGKNAPGTGL